jgi:RNA polymerase sigma-70 factor, ECF subfamily
MHESALASTDRETLERMLDELRPKLHRYCARMTGSAIDGEDVVQEAIVKALTSLRGSKSVAHFESWLFRIAHNASLDFLRRRGRHEASRSDADPETIAAPVGSDDDPQIVATSLRTFMRRPAVQRSAVILMDVFGYTLNDIGDITQSSVPAVKSALHRGRARLRELAREPDERPLPLLAERERSLLATYIERFNARDFDGVRDMLADEVRLDVVNRIRKAGRAEVGTYFQNYAEMEDWLLVASFVEGRPAILVRERNCASPAYFILLEWSGERVRSIRDYYHVRYVVEGAEIVAMQVPM